MSHRRAPDVGFGTTSDQAPAEVIFAAITNACRDFAQLARALLHLRSSGECGVM